MSYALFSSSWNNQFVGSSFVMETKQKKIDLSQGYFLMD